MRAFLRLLLAVLLLTSATRARAAEPDRIDRVVGLVELWAKVKFLHPWLSYKVSPRAWDDAFVAALPAVEKASDAASYAAAIATFLATLGDPLTRLSPPPVPPAGVDSEWIAEPRPGVLALDLGVLVAGDPGRVDMAQERVLAARALIIDLRAAPGRQMDVIAALYALADILPDGERWPAQRMVVHRGYRSQGEQSSGGYSTSFELRSSPDRPTGGKRPVFFLADEHTWFPERVLALQASGTGFVLATRAIDAGFSALQTGQELPYGLTAEIRSSELLMGDGRVAGADQVVGAARIRQVAVQLAARLAKDPGFRPRSARRRLAPALPTARVWLEDDYEGTPYPPRELRLLAAARLWAVYDYFSPYRYLAPGWDAELRTALVAMDAAADLDAYHGVLARQAASSRDGHVRLFPRLADEDRGYPPVAVRLVEGKPTVVRVIDAAAAKGLAPGDELLSVDGVGVAARMAGWRAEESDSTDEAREQALAQRLLLGKAGVALRVEVRGKDGQPRRVEIVPEASRQKDFLRDPHQGVTWKKLPGNVGYIDLTRLTVAEVDKVFAELIGTRAIVLDMRGYPRGTVWRIAPHINVKKASFGAEFLQPQVSADAWGERMPATRFLQDLPADPKAPVYRGKLVVLVDDRAISQAEHSCLFFAQAAGATFVGSPSHGANGDVTFMRLPGGLRLMFSGQEVRHVDGTRLQRVGIQPHIVVRPTLAGVRAGRDEVLERALRFVDTGK